MSQFPQQQGGWSAPPQNWNPNGTVPQGGPPPQQQGQWGQQPQQPQQQPQQQQQYGNQQWNPQAAGFVGGPPYNEGEFPYENTVTMAGQIYPNQYMPQGFEFRPGDRGGMLTANIKLRNSYTTNAGVKVRTSFIKIIAWGNLANALKNELQPGRLIRFTGEFRENTYVSKKDNKTKRVNQVALKDVNGQPAYQLGGMVRLIDEMPPRQNNGGGGGSWGGGQQAAPWGGQQPQQNWNTGQQQQPAQQPPQQAPWGAPPPQQQAPQQQGNWAPPQGGPPPQQQSPWGQPPAQQPQQPTHQAMPQGNWPAGGQFAPPQQGGPQQGPPQGQFTPPPQ